MWLSHPRSSLKARRHGDWSYIIDRCIINILACIICYNLAIVSANEGTLRTKEEYLSTSNPLYRKEYLGPSFTLL